MESVLHICDACKPMLGCAIVFGAGIGTFFTLFSVLADGILSFISRYKRNRRGKCK